MNKVYKIIWSRVKNCYVVVSELAKRKTKGPKSGIICKKLVTGVLTCVLSFDITASVYAFSYYSTEAINRYGYTYVIIEDTYDGDLGETGYEALAIRNSDNAIGYLHFSVNGQPSNAPASSYNFVSIGNASSGIADNGDYVKKNVLKLRYLHNTYSVYTTNQKLSITKKSRF